MKFLRSVVIRSEHSTNRYVIRMPEALVGNHEFVAAARIVRGDRKVVFCSAQLSSAVYADDPFDQDGPHEFIGVIMDEMGRPHPARTQVNITSVDAVSGTVSFRSTGPVEYLD
jgi:hypothetical protein